MSKKISEHLFFLTPLLKFVIFFSLGYLTSIGLLLRGRAGQEEDTQSQTNWAWQTPAS